MASLAQMLNQMTREDGSLDVIKRRLELDELIHMLLPDEIRRAKDTLSATTFVADIIPRLPMEILLLVVDYIDDLDDLKSMRTVSKTWQRIWTLEPICDKLTKKYFRSFFENTYQQIPQDEKCSAFVTLSEQLRTLRNGEYHSMKIYRYSVLSSLDHETSVGVQDRQYRNGRVAWAVEAAIYVYSLRTGTIKVYMNPSRSNITKWVLSDDILIFMSHDRVPQLHARYLCRTHEDSLHCVTLPGLPSLMTPAQGHCVGVIMETGEIFIWDVTSGRMKQLETRVDPLPKHREQRQVRIILPSAAQNTVYVCTVAKMKVGSDGPSYHRTVKWAMQKYSQGKLVKTSYLELPHEGLAGGQSDILVHAIKEIDDNGNFNICELLVDFPSVWSDMGCSHRWHGHKRSREAQRHIILQVAFNIYDDNFSTKFYHLPGGHKHTDDINFITPDNLDYAWISRNHHCWASNFYLPVLDVRNSEALSHDSPARIPVKSALIVAIKSCGQIQGVPTDINYMGGYGPRRSQKKVWTSEGRYPTYDLGVSHCLVGTIELAQQKRLPTTFVDDNGSTLIDNDDSREVVGDGSFLVVFSNFDFVVWSFNKSITLPDFE